MTWHRVRLRPRHDDTSHASTGAGAGSIRRPARRVRRPASRTNDLHGFSRRTSGRPTRRSGLGSELDGNRRCRANSCRGCCEALGATQPARPAVRRLRLAQHGAARSGLHRRRHRRRPRAASNQERYGGRLAATFLPTRSHRPTRCRGPTSCCAATASSTCRSRTSRQAFANLRRSGATWLLTTTFLEHHENADIEYGDWRMLNLTCAPFNLPAPEAGPRRRLPRKRGRLRGQGAGVVEDRGPAADG